MDIANKVDYSEDGIKDAVVVETKKSEAVSKDSDFENGTVPF
jgi:RNase P/RNase MRP subunit p29